MPEASRPDSDARLRAEVDLAVAPYVGRVSPTMLAKLRELAERYYRTQPEAARVLQLVERGHKVRSGTEARQGGDEDVDNAGGAKKGATG